jgi:hypothetical protein
LGKCLACLPLLPAPVALACLDGYAHMSIVKPSAYKGLRKTLEAQLRKNLLSH